ncbi:MAG: hypothetical protein E3J72_15180 [Planctomycetota bacterium]|nr:MAG: hypothetical protein E3J72_15180 [Planctomycetota bacterium]
MPPSSLVWAKGAGGTGNDYGRGIAALIDGSAIVTGSFRGIATFGAGEGNETFLSSVGMDDIFIARYNPDGTLAWAKSTGGGSGDGGKGISALSDGSAIVTGYFVGTVTFGNASEGNETVLSSAGVADIFIAKYNPDGTLAWAKRSGGGSPDVGYAISAIPDGSALLTGLFQGTATFGAGDGNETVLFTEAGDYNIFIAKYNPNGTLAWAKSAGGASGNDYGYGISALPDGSAIVTGSFADSATFGNASEGGNEKVLTSAGGGDIFIAKYNPNGTLAWVKSTGSVNRDEGLGISVLSDGSAIVTGYYQSNVTFGASEGNETVLTSAGMLDIFIAKYNPDGTLAWAKSAGGGNWDEGHGISTLPDGSALVTGYFRWSATFGNASEGNETVLITPGFEDIFIAKYNPDGTLAWAKRAGGVDYDSGYGISALSDGSAIVTGYFQNTAIFGAGEPNETDLISFGNSDIFIAKFNP